MSRSFILVPYSEDPCPSNRIILGFLPIGTVFHRLLCLPSPVKDTLHPRSPSKFKGKERMLKYASYLNGQLRLPRSPLRNVSCFLLPFLDHNWLLVCGPGEANSQTCSKGTGIFFTGVEPCFCPLPVSMENPTMMMYLEGGQNNRKERVITLSTHPLPLENAANSPRLIL